jgi:hypothetical protein
MLVLLYEDRVRYDAGLFWEYPRRFLLLASQSTIDRNALGLR